MRRAFWILTVVLLSVLALGACTKHNPQTRPSIGEVVNPGHGNHDPDPVDPVNTQPKERTDWKVEYLGRNNYTETDGSISRVEEFRFTYTGDAYFIVRSITAADFEAFYSGKLEDFLKGEVKDVITTAENENRKFYENTNSVFDKSQKGIVAFDMLIHGDYTTYIIEISEKGEATLNYAKLSHTVEEEIPVDEFLAWIGTWHVSDGYVGYDIVVSSCEANYLYYIDGWETGPAVQEQMNMERDWLYARYRNSTGLLYFYGQYLMSYYEESLGTDVDQMFVGTYLTSTSDSNGIVDVEGADAQYDIAHTWIDGETITVQPEEFTFDNGFKAIYHSMRYSRYCYDEQNWAHYNNSGVPSLPLTMQKVDPTKSSVHAPAVRTRTIGTLRREQLRPHVPVQPRTFRVN